MWTAIEGDDAGIMDDLHENRHVSRCLDDLIICGEGAILTIVVKARKHRWSTHRKNDAALRQRSAFRTVRRMFSGVGSFRINSFLRFRCERRNFPIGRIDDQGRAEVRCALGVLVPPEVVVGANSTWGRRLVPNRSSKHSVLVCSQFRRSEKLLSLKVS